MKKDWRNIVFYALSALTLIGFIAVHLTRSESATVQVNAMQNTEHQQNKF